MSLEFRTLLDMVDTAVSRSAISRAMKSFAARHGFAHHAFLDLQGSNTRYLGDYPDRWERLYLAERFAGLDPVVSTARRMTGTFFWSAPDWFAKRNPPLRRFAAKAIENGIAHGMTVAARASFDRQLLLTFAGQRGDYHPPRQQDLSDAVPVLMALHYRLRQIGGHQAQSTARRRLSSQELLCLTWAAKGKTAVETGLIMRLSTRTVQHYLDSAREKLGAATVPHLVAISKDIKLI